MGLDQLKNTDWKIHANNNDGALVFREDKLTGKDTGTAFDQPLVGIQLTGNGTLISFIRQIGPNYTQIYSGTVVGSGGGEWSYMMMGLFTEMKNGVVSMPYMWSTDPLLIPG